MNDEGDKIGLISKLNPYRDGAVIVGREGIFLNGIGRDDEELTLGQAIQEIAQIHAKLNHDWGKGGWGPPDAASLLKASRLDWLASLAETLAVFRDIKPTAKNQDGLLILAWANLGSLVEGAMKLFLSVFLNDYRNSVSRNRADSIFKSLWDSSTQQAKDVDGLMFERLRVFFEKEVWKAQPKQEWSEWLQHIQDRRNAIHAYKTRDLGTFEEFFEDVRQYRKFLRDEIDCFPDPPDNDWR